MIIPMGRVIRFAIATAMRLEEIFKVEWSDVDLKTRVVTIRDRKDPRHKVDLSRFRAAPSARLGHFPFKIDWAFPTQC